MWSCGLNPGWDLMWWIRNSREECCCLYHYYLFPRHRIGGTGCSVCRERGDLEMSSEMTLTHGWRNWKAEICFSLKRREKRKSHDKSGENNQCTLSHTAESGHSMKIKGSWFHSTNRQVSCSRGLMLPLDHFARGYHAGQEFSKVWGSTELSFGQ